MWFMLLGIALTLLKALDVALLEVSWLWVLSPFAAAALWWMWADASGLTKRREVEKMAAKQTERRRRHLAALGMDERGRRQVVKK